MSESLDPTIPIKWKEATNLIYQYHNNTDSSKLKTYIKSNGIETEAVLSGFSLTKAELKELTDNPNVDKILVVIGYNNDIRTDHAKGHSGIFIGIDKDENLLYGENDSIFNYSMPCPDNCPKDTDGIGIDFSKIQPISFSDE